MSKPLKMTLFMLNNKFQFEIIHYLNQKKMRFGEIKENIAEITQQLLIKQLRQMEKNHLVIRKEYDQFPKKVVYSLTTLGKSLNPIIKLMKKWEKDNYNKINKIYKKKSIDSFFDYF